MQLLTLIRGAQGAGKSTLARMIVENTPQTVHLEADMFFMDGCGGYNWNPRFVDHAHRWCKDRTKALLDGGKSVVVSNTFIRVEHLRPYVELANERHIPVQTILVDADFGNVHGVDPVTVRHNRQRVEPLPRWYTS
ncbi:AAA family ATPase [Pyruvatibacter mobilis]|uniref:AAA family ATPase n=1 Tax=Pyruvatibacter mobilis TaxID=1712261 RepID=UPI003BA90941